LVKPKHVGAFIVNLNILKQFNFALVGQIKDLRFNILSLCPSLKYVKVRREIFFHMALCSLVEVYRRFEGTCAFIFSIGKFVESYTASHSK